MKDDIRIDWTQRISENQFFRRDLPHFQNPGHLYFCTARTYNQREFSPDDRDLIMNSIHYLDGKHYDLFAAVIMPDHIHLVIRPCGNAKGEYISLSKIFHLLKGYTARMIGGHLWQHETYDHQVRNEKELFAFIEYMRNNPVKAGLVSTIDDYKWWWHYGMRESAMWGKPTGLPEVVLTGLPGVVSTGLPEVVSTGLPGVVSTGLPEVVSTGLPGVVSTGLPGVVSTGLPESAGNKMWDKPTGLSEKDAK